MHRQGRLVRVMQAQANHNLVEVPEIKAPFLVEAGPYAEEAQRRHMQWADRHGVFCSSEERRRFEAMDMGALADLLYPEASSPENLQLVADWCAWLLLRDDRWDSTEATGEWERLARRDRAYLRLMRHRAQRGVGLSRDEDDGCNSLYGALADLCQRLRTHARQKSQPEPVDRRLVAVMKGFFFASIRETAYQHRGTCPTLSEYVGMRSVTGGLDILTFVLGALDGVRLSKRLLDDPAVRRLTTASHNVCCWHNDLVSLNKELVSGEVHNLVLVLQQDPEGGRFTLPEAVDAAEHMICEELETFVDLKQEVGGREGPHARAAAWYAYMLRNRVGGVISWQESCAARYKEAFATSTSGRAKAKPDSGR